MNISNIVLIVITTIIVLASLIVVSKKTGRIILLDLPSSNKRFPRYKVDKNKLNIFTSATICVFGLSLLLALLLTEDAFASAIYGLMNTGFVAYMLLFSILLIEDK